MSDYEPNLVLSRREYRVVGKRPVRHDGPDKVTGRARYGADVSPPGMLHGRILRSIHAHAMIVSIDVERARQLDGVRAVVTASDFPDLEAVTAGLEGTARTGFLFQFSNVMARDKVFYKGQAIAAVAASSPHVAEEALGLIDVTYEPLPAVFTAEEAMRPGAPVLHDLPKVDAGPGAVEPLSGNVASRSEMELGDIEAGFAEADIIVERQTTTKAVHQGYIEPHSGTALWNDDGSLTVWSSSQGHFSVREFTARTMAVPLSRVRVVPLEIGGGFGAKLRVYVEPVAALLARATRVAVKVTMNRAEVFEATGPASGTQVTVKLGAMRDGRLVAAQARLVYEAGAFPGSSVMGGGRGIFAAYDIPNGYIEGYDVVVNRPKTAAYRAPGTPAAALCMETVLDELAEKLGMDPIELRLLNSATEGTRRISGPLMPKVGFREVLEAARNHPHYRSELEGPARGRGVASGFWNNGSGPSCVVAVVNPDGTVNLAEGSPDIGGTRTCVAQQLAEVLGIAIEDVNPRVADTDSIGVTSNTGGSGVAFKTGWAACEAAEDLKRQLIERAALIWEVSPDELEYEDGGVGNRSDAEQRLSFADLAARQAATGGALVGRAGVNPGGPGPTIATHIVDVEVDVETGKVDILRYTALQDAGKAIHPSYVEGQMQGGAAQGIGWALNEEYFIDAEGRMLNSSFLDYRMPTSLDLPMIDTVIVEVANPNHPFGVRGVGEAPIVPPLAAVANAIYDAVGVRVDDLPMTPAAVCRQLTALAAGGREEETDVAAAAGS